MSTQLVITESVIGDFVPKNSWFYPSVFQFDLAGIDLRGDLVCEALNTAWEYVRVVIPAHTNWDRYVAFARLILIAVIVEMRGTLVDVVVGDEILGFQLDELAHSPKDWFQFRDCDGLARFTIAGAMACNDLILWFREDEWQILSEIAETLYHSVAFYKHRAEGEIHSTYAYVDQELRVETFHRAREILWRFEVAWARKPKNQCVLNFVRNFGGPLHMTVRRYHFVEDRLVIGKPDTEDVTSTRQNFKLWNSIGVTEQKGEPLPIQKKNSYYSRITAQRSELMFDGLFEKLDIDDTEHCTRCRYRSSYVAEAPGRFGGVELCDGCKKTWHAYLEDLPARAEKSFPALLTVKPRHPPAPKTAREKRHLEPEDLQISKRRALSRK